MNKSYTLEHPLERMLREICLELQLSISTSCFSIVFSKLGGEMLISKLGGEMLIDVH